MYATKKTTPAPTTATTASGASAALEAWADAWVERLPLEPDAILTRGRGAHLSRLAAAAPRGLIVSWIGGQGPPVRDGGQLLVPTLEAFGALSRHLLGAGLEVYRADPRPTTREQTTDAARFEQVIAAARREALVEHGTLSQLADQWCDNLEHNLPRVMLAPSMGDAIDRLHAVPVLVAGAGPALATVLDKLLAHRDRFVLLAASSAVRPLWRAGVHPDAVVMIEGRDCTKHFAGLPSDALARVVLIADSATHPAHLMLPWGRMVFFHGAAGCWLEGWSGRGSIVPTGGNVGTTALVLAWMLGGRPVLAAGLDFAMSADGSCYTAHSGSTVPHALGPLGGLVRAWDGGTLPASAELICYREQTEQILGVIHNEDPAAEFLCLTARGARVAEMRLDASGQSLAQLPPLPRTRAADALLWPPSQRTMLDRGPDRIERGRRTVMRSLERLSNDPSGPHLALALAAADDLLLRLLVIPGLIRGVDQGRPAPEAARAAIRLAEQRMERMSRRAILLAERLTRP
ncbi:MAG: DUF115 domain-containing protein [Acidobacteriota bacterium]|nr:MAG: DUF115 domain-containing protein [Acidobacteriota bacterium]